MIGQFSSEMMKYLVCHVCPSELIVKIFTPYSAEIYFRRQILTSKVHHRGVRVNIFVMAVVIQINRKELGNLDSYDDFKFKRPLISMINTKMFQSCKG